MVKVLYIISTLKRTGPTNVLYNLIYELNRNEFDPYILTLSSEDVRFPSLYSTFEKLGVKIESLGLTRLKGFLRGKALLKKFVADNLIDIIHINGIRGDLLIGQSDFDNIPIITTINSNIYDDYTMLYGKFKGSIMARMHMNSLKGKVAIGCSDFVVTNLNKMYGSNLKTIYNGIPKNKYSVPTEISKLQYREMLNIALNTKVFVFVGYLIYRKDPLTTIKGFLKANKTIDSILLVIGDGPLMKECKEIAGDLLNKTIFFYGNQPETLKYLNASDFYISSAYSEGLPTSVMEAMGCGLPVLLSNIPPHIELTNEMSNWDYLFHKNDDGALANKIDMILEQNYKKLSNECRYVIDEKINSSVMAKNYQSLYTNVAK